MKKGLLFRMTVVVLMALWALPSFSKKHVLWYNLPAKHWVEALPLGNGRLGAMVYGGIHSGVVRPITM